MFGLATAVTHLPVLALCEACFVSPCGLVLIILLSCSVSYCLMAIVLVVTQYVRCLSNVNCILVYEVEFPDGEMAEYTATVIAENLWAQCDEADDNTYS